MSEELQNETLSMSNDSTDITESQSAEVIENSKEPELATETQSETAEVKAEPTEEDKEAKRQAAFNKQYGEKKQLERELEAAKAKNLELQQAQQPQSAPQLGEFPSEYDYDTTEEFETAKNTYVQNAQAVGRHEAQQQASLQASQQQHNREAQQKQEKVNADVITYTENAKKNGIDASELQSAANAVESYGITPDLTYAILADPDGPLLTKYLAANPQEVTNLIGMNPYAAGAHMLNLKAKAVALKPKTSNAPKPSTDIQGGGAAEKIHPALRGVIYS
jgi:hypothetical protein